MDSNQPEPSKSHFINVAERLWRHKTTGVYYAFVKKGGKQFRRSLKTTDRQLAGRRLADLLADFARLMPSEAANLSFDQVAEQWLANTRHTIKESSHDRRQRSLKSVSPFFSGLPIKNVAARHCEAWLTQRVTKRGDKIAPQTFAHELNAMRAVFKYAMEQGWILRNPASGIKRRRIVSSAPAVPTREQLRSIVAANHRVDFAGALAGYTAGIHESGGIRFLVTESPAFIMPKPGKWDKIRLHVESQFYDAGAADGKQRHQVECFYILMSESYAAYYRRMVEGETNKFRHCPALAIFGPRLCGKSVLIDLVVTPLFGGKKADPMNFLRDGKFNKDLFGASLLVLDDKGASANLAERRQRGESIKALLWNQEQRMEGKGQDALNLRPFWRMVIASNDDHAGLQICPALSPSLEDKILILRAQQAEGLPQNHEDRDVWADEIRAELSAFAAFLLSYRPPDNVTLDPRTRVPIFQHPKIVAALRELQPEMRLLELIDTLGLIDTDAPLWEGRATEFEQAMKQKDAEGLLTRVLNGNTGTTGKMLTEIERLMPERVNVTTRNGSSYYKIFRAH